MQTKLEREQEIDAMLAVLRRAWTEAPELRLCQLLANVVGDLAGDPWQKSIFYAEDQKLATSLTEFYQVARKANLLAALRTMESRCLDDEGDLLAVADRLVSDT